MRLNLSPPYLVSEDLRVMTARPDRMTPAEALQLAERLTLAAMMRQASLEPARRTRRLRAGLVKVAI